MPVPDVAELLERAAAGDPPPADGRVEVVPQPPGPVAGILAFAAHHVVAADVDPAWVHARLPRGDFAAPVGPAFVSALADRLGRTFDNLDVVLAAPALGGRAGGPAGVSAARLGQPGPAGRELGLVEQPVDGDHPRLARARRYRTDLSAWATADGRGLLVVGRGLAGRWEAAVEVEPAARGRGIGRALAMAARELVPAGRHVFVQAAPGNVPSLRAVLAVGFRPVGGEILFPEAAER